MKKILTIGNALVDVIIIQEREEILEHFNIPKGSMQIVDLQKSSEIIRHSKNLSKKLTCGGSAANTARSLSMLGIETGYIGKVGKDEYGNFFASETKKSGVVPLLIQSETPTGTAVTLVSNDYERTFATYLGASAELIDKDISKENFQNYYLVHIEGYMLFNNKLIEKVIETSISCGLKISIDFASYNVVESNLDFLKHITKNYIDIVFANEEEAKFFTGKEARHAVDEISEMCEIAVVKIGKKGSFVKNRDLFVYEKAIYANPVDTTGAGDNYAAGFLYGYANKWSLNKCVKAGTILAGNVIEVLGTTMDNQRWKIIRENIKNILTT